ncbi:hypothetical protein ACFWNT_44235 [Streptomyces sp. NPDC058409]|uniref:hypothetical protein n=1 Tax=Streptomyces sp. NPDC058409 TaxID=3346484 RepID=UPI0036558ABE
MIDPYDAAAVGCLRRAYGEKENRMSGFTKTMTVRYAARPTGRVALPVCLLVRVSKVLVSSGTSR